MPNKKLINYIKEQTRKGFDSVTIRNYLVKYGYSPRDIDEAFRAIYGNEVRHVIHLSGATWAGLGVIIIGIIISASVLFFLPSEPKQLLDLSLDSVESFAEPGTEYGFIIEMSNLGSAKRYDVVVEYELFDLQTNEVVTTKTETIAIETSSSKRTSVAIPMDAGPGEYILRATANYNGQEALATLTFNVKTSEIYQTAGEEVEVIEEEVIEEETTEETVEEDAEEPETDTLNTYETLEEVERIASGNRREAEKLCVQLQLQTSKDLCFNKIAEVLGDRSYCQKIRDERTKDVCFSNVALIVNKNEICEDVVKESRKDNCYIKFVLPDREVKDYSVCDKITNQYLKQSCDSLKQLSKLNVTDVSFYQGLINESLIEFV